MTEIQLRDCVSADLDAFYANESDEEAARVVNFPHRSRLAFDAHWNDNILGNPKVDKRTVLVNGTIAGNIVSWDDDGERELGYWFGREFWGRGIGTVSVRAFVQGVEQRPLYARVAAANTASVRLLEKCGFTIVATFTAPNAYAPGDVDHVKLRLD